MSTNDKIKTTPAPGAVGGTTAAWWTTSLGAAWDDVKADAMADWKKLLSEKKKVGHAFDDQALAFGHGARTFYRKLSVWGGELEDRLKADWKAAGHDATTAWENVSSAVQHGWETAGRDLAQKQAQAKSGRATLELNAVKPSQPPAA